MLLSRWRVILPVSVSIFSCILSISHFLFSSVINFPRCSTALGFMSSRIDVAFVNFHVSYPASLDDCLILKT